MTTPTKEQIKEYIACLRKEQKAHQIRYNDSRFLEQRNLHYGGFLALNYALQKVEEILINSPK